MLEDHKIKEMPVPPRLRDLLGPSFILLGLGLGSGELILWPHLTSQYGMGIIWAAILGVTLQFFMNMEIERYALTRGESIFVGFARLSRALPYWFILSTLLPWIWPGIIVSGASLLAEVLNINNVNMFSIVLMILIGVILTLGPVLYKTQELFQKIVILVGTPFILLISLFVAKNIDWINLGWGIMGRGEGFWFLPKDISIAAFLAAIAYSGAGGNLNLAQSFYIKEKGFGMGKYAGRITSLLTGKVENMDITGTKFVSSEVHIKRFREWWRLINLEHGIVFWFMGVLTIVVLAFLSYITVFGKELGPDITFVFREAAEIGAKTFPIIGRLFLIVGGLMLFSTQMGVLDTTSRILTENLTLTSRKLFPVSSIRRNFFIFLWLQILAGIIVILFGFDQPLALITTAAILNALAMFVHIALTLWLNITRLEKEIRPNLFRIIMMLTAFVFFGFFAGKVFLSYL